MNQARTRRRLGDSAGDAEVYQVLWCCGLVCEEDRTLDRHDALCIAAWMSRAYRDGSFAGCLKPQPATVKR
jgi:hypothetical protein